MYADNNIFHEPGTDCPERITGLQALLEGAPPLPDHKLLWHCALEKLLDGTREGSSQMVGDWNCGLRPTAELHTRVEELETLKDQVQAVKTSIAKAVSDETFIINHYTDPFHQEMCICDLNIEFEKLESTESIDSAQAAAVTSHKEWLGIESVDVNVQKNLSNLFSSGRALKEKLESEKILKVNEAFKEYSNQGEPRKGDHHADRPDPDLPGLRYRRIVIQQRHSQEQFLNSIPDRVQVKLVLFVRVLIDLQAQEYGTKYWAAVCEVGMVMESFSNYLRYA